MSDALDKAFAEAIMSPQVQMAMAHLLWEFSQCGPAALAFAEACDKKDYTILQDDWAKDKAEFERLAAEWRAESAPSKTGVR